MERYLSIPDCAIRHSILLLTQVSKLFSHRFLQCNEASQLLTREGRGGGECGVRSQTHPHVVELHLPVSQKVLQAPFSTSTCRPVLCKPSCGPFCIREDYPAVGFAFLFLHGCQSKPARTLPCGVKVRKPCKMPSKLCLHQAKNLPDSCSLTQLKIVAAECVYFSVCLRAELLNTPGLVGCTAYSRTRGRRKGKREAVRGGVYVACTGKG